MKNKKVLYHNTVTNNDNNNSWNIVNTVSKAWLRSMVGRVSAYQPDTSSSISGRVKNFNSNLGAGCVSFAHILCCLRWRPCDLLTLDPGRPAFVLCLVLWLNDMVLPTGVWPGVCMSYKGRRVKNGPRKKIYLCELCLMYLM